MRWMIQAAQRSMQSAPRSCSGPRKQLQSRAQLTRRQRSVPGWRLSRSLQRPCRAMLRCADCKPHTVHKLHCRHL